MALIKCPECNNQISDKASSCPVCGCPSLYFETNLDTLDDRIISFEILGHKIDYPKTISSAAKDFGYYFSLIEDTYILLRDIYKESENLTDALSAVPSAVNEILDNLIDKAIEDLYSQNITIDSISFINKYQIGYQHDYEPQIEPIISKYINIQYYSEMLKAKRRSIKASRGKWRGGGFGLTGAVKGVVMASALNAGSSLLHAGGDALRYSRDSDIIRQKYSDLYNENSTKDELCHIENAIINIYNAYILEIQNNNPNAYIFTPVSAYRLFELTNKHEKDINKKIESYIKCIGEYPGNPQYYKMLENITSVDLQSEFEGFLKFWNIKSPFR